MPVLIALMFALLSACMETTQTYTLNKDGSGRVELTVRMPLKLNMQMNADQSGAKTYEDRVKLVKKVRKLINRSEGVEAWKDIAYRLEEDGMLYFEGTAYFPDITQLHIDDVPIIPVASITEDHMKWAIPDEARKKGKSAREDLSEEEVNKLMKKIRRQYRQSKGMMQMFASRFYLEASYHLPAKLKHVSRGEQKNSRTLAFTLEGSDMINEVSGIMEDDGQLRTLIAEKGMRKFDFEHPALYEVLYPEGNFMAATFKTGLFAPDPQNYFPYRKTVDTMEPKIPEIPMPEKPEPAKKQLQVFTGLPQSAGDFWEAKGMKGAFAMEGEHFVVFNNSNGNERIQVYDLPAKSLHREIPVSSEHTWGAQVAGNPKRDAYLFTAEAEDMKGLVKILDAESHEPLFTLQTKGRPADAIWLDNDRFAVALYNSRMVVGNKATQTQQTLTLTSKEPAEGLNLVAIDTMHAGSQVYLYTLEKQTGSLKVWDTDTWNAETHKIENPGLLNSMHISPASGNLLALRTNKTIEVYKHFSHYRTLDNRALGAISWNPDGSLLAYVDNAGTLCFYNPKTDNVTKALDKNVHNTALLSGSGNYLITEGELFHGQYKILKLQYE